MNYNCNCTSPGGSAIDTVFRDGIAGGSNCACGHMYDVCIDAWNS